MTDGTGSNSRRTCLSSCRRKTKEAKISQLDTSRNLQVQGFHRRPCQTTGEITSPVAWMAGGKAPSRCWLLKPGSYSTHRKFCSLLKASHHRHLNKNIEIYISTCNSFSTHQKPFINQKQNMVLVSMAFLRVACFLFQNLLSGMFKRAPALMTASWPSIGNNNSPEDWSEWSRGSWRMGRWHVHPGRIQEPPLKN